MLFCPTSFEVAGCIKVVFYATKRIDNTNHVVDRATGFILWIFRVGRLTIFEHRSMLGEAQLNVYRRCHLSIMPTTLEMKFAPVFKKSSTLSSAQSEGRIKLSSDLGPVLVRIFSGSIDGHPRLYSIYIFAHAPTDSNRVTPCIYHTLPSPESPPNRLFTA